MRYIDSGERDLANALGHWLEAVVLDDPTVVALRWQSGFFSAGPLGYFAPLMAKLQQNDGLLHVLVGSNDGATRRADVEALLAVAGPPRSNQRIGVVKFKNAYFHPKTVHGVRDDGSAFAYVGSANLTESGVSSLHVEAGVLIDSRDGDDEILLERIANAVDWWFEEDRDGLEIVSLLNDVDQLVAAGVLNVPPPPHPPGSGGGGPASTGSALAPLIKSPPLPAGLIAPPDVLPSITAPAEPAHEGDEPAPTATPVTTPGVAVVRQWSKELSPSDAQRKTSGHQRGSITLVKAGYDIDLTTYFRNHFFGDAQWTTEPTSTGGTREQASVPFAVNVLGQDLGVLQIVVSHAASRESDQANYTSLLHLGPLAQRFADENMTDRWINLAVLSDGTYALSISEDAAS